jgi:hypothetical protein
MGWVNKGTYCYTMRSHIRQSVAYYINLILFCESYQPILLSAQFIRMLVWCFDVYTPPKQFISDFYSSQERGAAIWTSVRKMDKIQASQIA